MTMYHGAVAGAATTSITILVLISSTATITQAKIDHITTSIASDTLKSEDNVHRDAVAADTTKSIDVAATVDNTAEPDEHHRIVILVPQLIRTSSPYSQRSKKPKKKKPKVHHHHHPHVVPVVHSGKVIHAHHHHGNVNHGHSHAAKAKHIHKHYGKGHQKHSHYGVGRITHKHAGHVSVKPSSGGGGGGHHKPKHWSAGGGAAAVDVFNNNAVGPFGYPNYPAHRQFYSNQQQQQQQQQRYPQPTPPSHLQHQQQILHHRAFAQPNFFSNAAAFGADSPPSPPSHFNGIRGIPLPTAGGFGGGGAGYRTANDRRDLLSRPPPSNVAGQLIQIRRIPSSPSEQLLDTFIDKDTRSSLAAAALTFGNENENEYANAIADVDADADAENENENEENENEEDANETENENENENENESVKDEEYVTAVGGLDRAIGEAASAFTAVPRSRRKSAVGLRLSDTSNSPAFGRQLDRIDDDEEGAGNQASLHYATFAQPPPSKNKIVAFSDAYHYQY